jgi:hypothetical protein
MQYVSFAQNNVAQFAPLGPRMGFHSYSCAGSIPWDFAKLMHVSPAIAVAKELQAGEMPAWVSVSVDGWALAVGDAVVLTAVVDAVAPVPKETELLLDPAPTQ